MAKKLKDYTLNEVRKFYGFSQEHLSTYLGVSRSTLNMTERGERSLNVDSEIKLLKLVREMTAAKTAAKKELPAKSMDKKRKKTMISGFLKDVEHKMKKLEKKMEMARLQYENYSVVLNAVSNLRSGAGKRELIVLDLMQSVLKNKIGKTKEDDLLKAELQAVLLMAEKKFWQEKLKSE